MNPHQKEVPPPMPASGGQCRMAVEVRGVVQGVGFRPFVYISAHRRGLRGWVRNEADTVRIEVQGDTAEVTAFLTQLRDAPPPQARIESLVATEVPCLAAGEDSFAIHTSQTLASTRPTLPADLATCRDCVEEIFSPGERRHRYPFTNCTNCGPRWSIIREVPYDRPRTSMAGFAMCPACQGEYTNPADRRFHAQPIACPECGPTLELLDAAGQTLAGGQDALDGAVAALRAGRIVAMKGLGGFQLLVDATGAAAVERLRRRKRRPAKPLAVLLSSLDEVHRRCEVSSEEAQSLESCQAPIVLLRKRHDPSDVAEPVAPGNPFLGVMLPYTPLHHLLAAAMGKPLVCTSGNLSEEPMAITTEDARKRLLGDEAIADVLLTHHRPIVRPVDDSVVQGGPDGIQVLRRARGFAPLPIALGRSGPTVLAVGGHLKNTVAISLDGQAILSAHVGDLDSLAGVEVHQRAIVDLLEFFHAVPARIACDLHPDYASTRHAESLAATWMVPLVRVQHHHAHVASCMAEHHLEGPVLGFSWDGTGYGPDGTLWGGEALECAGATYRRVAHLRTFPLPGGNLAIRQPRRSAIGLGYEMFGEAAGPEFLRWFSSPEGDGESTHPLQRHLWELLGILGRGHLSPRTSSVGRLFDAVAALCDLPIVGNADGHSGRSSLARWLPSVSFEGQAAMALQFAAQGQGSPCPAYPVHVTDREPMVIDWEPTIRAVLADRAAGVAVGDIAARFHEALAAAAVTVARRWGGKQVVLSGGCFHNVLLTGRVRAGLLEAGFEVFTHHQVPPGDGGIALGQIAVAACLEP